ILWTRTPSSTMPIDADNVLIPSMPMDPQVAAIDRFFVSRNGSQSRLFFLDQGLSPIADHIHTPRHDQSSAAESPPQTSRRNTALRPPRAARFRALECRDPDRSSA